MIKNTNIWAVIFAFLVRLVFSDNNGNTSFEIDKTLSFYVESETVEIYKGVLNNRLSFTMALPNYPDNAFELLDSVIKKLDKLKHNKTSEQGLLLQSQIEEIKLRRLKLKEYYLELKDYIGKDNIYDHLATCNSNLTYTITPQSVMLLYVNMDTLYNNFDLTVTTADLDKPLYGKYLNYRNTLTTMNTLMFRLENFVSDYLKIIEGITAKTVTYELLNYLKNTDCMDPNPDFDSLNLEFCKFGKSELVCVLHTQHPFDAEHFIKLIPVNYFNYELDLEHVYRKEDTDDIFEIECSESFPVLQNCRMNYFNTDCVYGLMKGNMDIILDECLFIEKIPGLPTQVKDGILIPEMPDLQIFSIKNLTKNYDKDFQEIHINESKPYVIKSKTDLLLTTEFFSIIFPKSAIQNTILTTSFSAADLNKFTKKNSAFFVLGKEEINLIINVSLSTFLIGLIATGVFLYYRFRTVRNALQIFEQKYPEPKYTREMKRFINEK